MTRTTVEVPAPGAARSFWLQEALAADPGEPAPPLAATLSADVCIVGGGFAGLWTAIELTEREPDLRIALLERDICGGGASGRNGGFFSSSWWDAPAICGLFGEREGLRYAGALADSIAEAGAWVEEHDVDAWFHHEGTMAILAGSWQQARAGSQAISFLERRGLGDRLRPMTVERARGIADSPRIEGARFMPDGAVVQPARLARGLRRVALERGVAIFERTDVVGIDHGRPAVIRARDGAVKAEHVVLTMGAWAAGWPGFRRSFGVVADHMVVTEPIPEALEEIGWTSNVGIADGRDLLYYLRPTDDGRIAIGGGGLSVIFGGHASSRAATHDRRVAEVAARGLVWLFPKLEGVKFTHAWGGPIDQTASFLPFFRTQRPGNVHVGLGFSGHGLSQTMVGGKILASLVLGADDDWSSLPVVGPGLGKAPPEPLRYPAVRAAAWALERGDRREEGGRSRGAITGWIGEAPTRNRERLVARASRGRLAQ
jgi:glycine/D-amino acid oxidase-like deaminating enzyme